MNRIQTVILSGAIILGSANAAGAESDSADVWIPGVLFSFGATDGAIVQNGNALSVWLGAGYDISSSWRISALFSTGHHQVDNAAGRPVTGTLLLGAATVQILHAFPGWPSVRPYLAVDGGLSTILNNQSRGYNGWTVNLSGGLEWKVTQALAVDGFVEWGMWEWRNGVGDNIPSFDNFSLGNVGAGVSVIFHPVLHRQSQ